MPERSEWLVAGGAAKRNPRYRATNHNASERREYHFPPRQNSRPSISLQSESDAVALLKKLMKIITTKDRFLPLL